MRANNLPPLYSAGGIDKRIGGATTRAEAETITRDVMKNMGFDVPLGGINIQSEVKIPVVQKMLTQINRLSREYDLSKTLAQRNTPSIPHISFGVQGKYLGVTTFKEVGGFGIDRVNFGGGSQLTRGQVEGLDFQLNDVYTAIHEFAHILTNREQVVMANSPTESWIKEINGLAEARRNTQRFWREADKLYEQYTHEMENLWQKVGGEHWELYEKKIKLLDIGEDGSRHGLDEFVAECFAQYKLDRSPSKYAKKIGNLIDKYFHR